MRLICLAMVASRADPHFAQLHLSRSLFALSVAQFVVVLLRLAGRQTLSLRGAESSKRELSLFHCAPYCRAQLRDGQSLAHHVRQSGTHAD